MAIVPNVEGGLERTVLIGCEALPVPGRTPTGATTDH
jgi:hypothetical protein